jgi:hypothetical protein
LILLRRRVVACEIERRLDMKKTFAARLLTAMLVFLLFALGHLACGGSGYKSPTAPVEFGGTPTPMGAPTPTPGTGY